mgnify:CR=1 FL=1
MQDYVEGKLFKKSRKHTDGPLEILITFFQSYFEDINSTYLKKLRK